jgi:isoamylase
MGCIDSHKYLDDWPSSNCWRARPDGWRRQLHWQYHIMSTKAIHYGGKSFPLGATLSPGGANFSIFAKHSRAAQLLLFDRVDDSKPSRVIDLRSAYQPHIPLLAHLRAGRHRGPALWLPRSGPFRSRKGAALRPRKVLLDPHGKCLARPLGWSREAARRPGDDVATALKNVAVGPSTCDWRAIPHPDGPLPRLRPSAAPTLD